MFYLGKALKIRIELHYKLIYYKNILETIKRDCQLSRINANIYDKIKYIIIIIIS